MPESDQPDPAPSSPAPSESAPSGPAPSEPKRSGPEQSGSEPSVPRSGSERPDYGRPRRKIDARSLRGLAHPLRMRLLQLLRLDGPATATGLAGRLGENTGTTSWHLRQLAEHGFIEEDPDRGSRRERWWRAVRESTVLEAAEFFDDPATRGPVEIVLNEYLNYVSTRTAAFLSEVDGWDRVWYSASTLSDWDNLRLTPERLRALNQELFAVIDRYAATVDPDEPGAEHVVVQVQSFPRRRHSVS